MRKTLKAPPAVIGSKVTVRLPTGMIHDLKKDMALSGYEERAQSRWIAEAIEQLTEMPGYEELVAEDFIAEGRNKSMKVSLPGPTTTTFKRALKTVRAALNKTDVQSMVVRTAVLQRLIKSDLTGADQ